MLLNFANLFEQNKVSQSHIYVCVQRVLVYGSETWPMEAEDMQCLERTERMMVRLMCGASLKSRISSETWPMKAEDMQRLEQGRKSRGGRRGRSPIF